jgi:hypothetical protein
MDEMDDVDEMNDMDARSLRAGTSRFGPNGPRPRADACL